MSEENKESRLNIEDLPQGEQELTAEDSKAVQGGDSRTRLIIGDDQGVWRLGGDSVKP